MRVKIAGKVFDSEEGLIMLHLTEDEKANLAAMSEKDSYFAAFHKDQTPKVVLSRLERFKKEEEEGGV